MKPTAIPLLVLAAVVIHPAPATPAGPVGLSARAEPGPHHVGQAIEVRVEAAGRPSAGRPVIDPPAVAGAEVRPSAPVGDDPGVARFVVIPRKPGPLEIPPFRARPGEPTAATRPIRLTIAAIPAAGRTPAFLGGVGPFQVGAEAEPSTVRTGQTIEFRLTITGPAAWGSIRGPDLAGWASLPPGFRVEPLADAGVGGDPPARTFRYRLRPSTGGPFVLPPVAIAAFDPKLGGFATRYSPGVPIRVDEPARFDPARLDYGGEGDGSNPGSRRLRIAVGAVVAGLGPLAAIVLARRWRRATRPVDPIRVAAELARGLDPDAAGPEAARQITDGLATLLRRAGGRAPGVLTPPEARECVGRLTLDPDLAGRAGRLIERCDRARYGGHGDRAADLVIEARGILGEIGRGMGRGGRPREAVETA